MLTTTATANKTTQSQGQKKKSWAIMAFEADEEERLEKEEEAREKINKIVKERQYLHSIGKYELEEGEILE